MDSIIHLVKNMQAGEIKLLRHFHKLQHNNDIKKNLLFEKAVKWKNCNDLKSIEHKAFLSIYGTAGKSEKSFEKLKFRLKTDILNILLLQDSSVKCLSRQETAVFECRRLILQADVLLGRGVYKEGISLLKRASGIAQKNELYTEQLLIDNLFGNHNIVKSGENEHLHYSNNIRQVTSLMEKSMFAKYFHDELMACSLLNTNIVQPVDEWRLKLERIKQDHQLGGSVKIGFYYNFSALHFYRHTKDYDKSLEFGLTLYKYTELHELFQTPGYLGNINRELARCYLLAGQCNGAMKHAKISIRHFSNDPLNALAAIEILFFSHVNKQEYAAAKEITDKAFSYPYLKNNNFENAKWWFLRAGAEFKMHEFTKAINCLKKCNELFRDKSSWLLGYTFFEVLCRIESGDLEWFEYRLEGIKKLMLRHNRKKTANHNQRFDLIFRILKTLNKNNYNFTKICNDEKESIALLARGEGAAGWHLTGLEPVRFDEWLKGKAGLAM
jgi:tetratricopeptide (TPR) repeat protein